ncbi:MAG: DUF5916 domain-containing protein, partial [Bacteroidota bacterium]|nr:DUF5916 domain-containing protein [Bacteroidota bacterium]
MKKSFGVVAFLSLAVSLMANEKKSMEAYRLMLPITVDGVLDEPVYQQVPPAKDFVQLQPYNGKPSFQPTETWLFYDQTAIYVGAMLYDSSPDSIFNYLTERDDTGTSDYFGVYIDPYNQGQLAYGFFVTPAGVQVDIKAIKNSDGDNESSDWNAVWDSKTRITDKGWIVEMRIPYSALRFSNQAGDTWGLNFFRNIRRYNSNNSWNFIDRNGSGFIYQEGALTGIKDIKPPVRLSLSPYLSTYFNAGKNDDPFLYKAGLDLKYGLNESFTLDMMLIPDFGQVQSDDRQLNLTPYELYYNEKRQFFTEGMELFNRAGIFYSRRIGAAPKFSASDQLKDGESVTSSSSETQLVNATKVSGRTGKGWGIGVLNAMSLPAYATLTDSAGSSREVMVQPFTNYNVSVVDKSLKYNSYVSLINTNVSMYDNPFRANVTATEFVLRNKKMNWALTGKGGVSVRGLETYETGAAGYLSLDKNKGKVHFGISQDLITDIYNPNDLGYMDHNNEVETNAYVYYQEVKPFWKIREYNGNIWTTYARMYQPDAFSKTQTGYNFNVTFKNNYYINLNGGFQGNAHEYYETRVPGRYYATKRNWWNNYNIQSDWRKPFYVYAHFGHSDYFDTDQHAYFGDADLVWKVGQHVQLEYAGSFKQSFNESGFVDKSSSNDSILFAKRNVYTLSNVLAASYVINNKTSLTLKVRHYWSGAKNKNYSLLQTDGSLLP